MEDSGGSVRPSAAPDEPGLRPNRACRACVQIKAKCVPRGSDLSTCERCYRLGKQCTTPAPRKRARKQPGELAQLQQEIARLTRALENQQDQEFRVSAALDNQNYPPHDYTERGGLNCHNFNTYEDFPKRANPFPGTVFNISPEVGHMIAAPTYETLFEHFKTSMTKHYPFVIFKPDSPTQVVMKQQPFAFTCSVMVALYRDPAMQTRVARDILKYLGEHLLLAGEKTLDLLQGILLFVAYYHVYAHNNPQLMNLLHLAKALLVDLGLNRPVGTSVFQTKMSTEANAMVHGNDSEFMKHSLAERRAFLGFYYCHSKFSTTFRRLDPIRWTEHGDECCSALQDAAQYSTDMAATALVRLRRLLHDYTDSFKPGPSLPIQTYIQLFSNDIQRFKQSLPSQLQMDPLILIEIASTELYLFEPVAAAEDQQSAHKLKALHLFLTKVNAYFDLLLAQSLHVIPDMPFISWLSTAYAFEILERLSFLKMDGWDLEYVRNNPGFLEISDRVMAKMNQVHRWEEATYAPLKTPRFKVFATRMGKFKTWYEIKIQQEEQQNAVQQHATNAAEDAEDPLLPSTTTDHRDMLWADLISDWPRFDMDMNFGFSSL